MGEKRCVAVLQRRIKICGNLFGCLQMRGAIPWQRFQDRLLNTIGQRYSATNVFRLCSLVAPGKQNDNAAVTLDEVYPISWPIMNAEFEHPLADWPPVSG